MVRIDRPFTALFCQASALPYSKHPARLKIRMAGAPDGSAEARDFTYRLQEMQGMRSALKDVAPVTGGDRRRIVERAKKPNGGHTRSPMAFTSSPAKRFSTAIRKYGDVFRKDRSLWSRLRTERHLSERSPEQVTDPLRPGI